MTSELGKKMLLITAKRGYTGASREVFFHFIRGIRYADLEKEVLALERENYITIEWVGPSNFTVSITPKGVELVKSFQEDVWKKSVDALQKVREEEHEEKSIIHGEVGYTRMIDEKMGVEEVGDFSREIIEKLDEHIKAEREAASEEAGEDLTGAIGVPAVVELGEEESVELKEDVVERRISGEMESKETGEGKEIPMPSEDIILHRSRESRIAAEKGTTIETKIKERRISGELDRGASAKKLRPPRVKKMSASPPKVEEASPEEVLSALEEISEVKAPSIDDSLSEVPVFPSAETQQEAKTEPEISIVEFRCVWEADHDCQILKEKQFEADFELTSNHCIMCQLLEIKRILKK